MLSPQETVVAPVKPQRAAIKNTGEGRMVGSASTSKNISPVQSWQEMKAQTARYGRRFQQIAELEYPAAVAKRRAASPNYEAVERFAEDYKRRFEEQHAEDAAREEKQWKRPPDNDNSDIKMRQLLLVTGYIHALHDPTPVGTMTVAELAVDPTVRTLALQDVWERMLLPGTEIPQLINAWKNAPSGGDPLINYLQESEGSYLDMEKQLMDHLAMDARSRSYQEKEAAMSIVEEICGHYLGAHNMEMENLRFECEEMFSETQNLLSQVPHDSAEHQELLTEYGEMLALMRNMHLWRNLDQSSVNNLLVP